MIIILDSDNTIKYVERKAIEDTMIEFVRKLLKDGRVKVVEGQESYFAIINGEPSDKFSEFLEKEKLCKK